MCRAGRLRESALYRTADMNRQLQVKKLDKPTWDGNRSEMRPKEDGKCEGIVPVKERLEGKDEGLTAVVDDRDLSVAQRASTAGSAIGLDSLKDIIFSHIGEPPGEGR
jgi:hypothetical protein